MLWSARGRPGRPARVVGPLLAPARHPHHQPPARPRPHRSVPTIAAVSCTESAEEPSNGDQGPAAPSSPSPTAATPRWRSSPRCRRLAQPGRRWSPACGSMRRCTSRPRPGRRAQNGRPRLKGRACRRSRPSPPTRPPPGRPSRSPTGTARASGPSRSPRTPRSGTTPACRRCRCAGCSSATRRAGAPAGAAVHRPGRRPRAGPGAGSCSAGSWRSRLEEARRHLGVETQRQWSERAIRRTTPALLGLFSLVTLLAHRRDDATRRPRPGRPPGIASTAPTFADALALVRRELWRHQALFACHIRLWL